MRALWLENQTLTYRTDLPQPTPGPRQALVQVRLAGICSTDLELARGYYPYSGVPGHEFVGTVVGCDEPGWLSVRVAGEINAACGECATCRAGRPTHCERRRVLGISGLDGAFAEYLVLPLSNLHRVPASVPDEAAVFVEPLAAALEILEQVKIHPTDRVLVVGAGRLGQLIARVLSLTGCDLYVLARHAHQRSLLASHPLRFLTPDEIPLKQMDVVVEATGNPSGFSLACQAVRPRGVIVLKSTYKGDLTANFSALVVDEVTLIGSRCGPFAPAIRLLESDLVNPLPLVAARYALAEGVFAFEQAAQPGMLKVLLRLVD